MAASHIHVFLAGPGLIGGALLRQIATTQHTLAAQRIVVKLCGLARSARFVVSKEGLDPSDPPGCLAKGKDGQVGEFVTAAAALHLPNSVLVDCTASDALTPCYSQALKAGMHVVTANKKANTADMATFKSLAELSCVPGGPRFWYEANVGAGLPVISTLKDFIATGDEVIEIQGILSGTLAYIFNTLDADHRFSDIVKEAQKLGFCEPDPRDDLGGSDVARKITILARIAGAEVELGDVHIDPICPDSVSSAPTVDEFLERVAKDFDPAIEQRRKDAAAKGEVLRVIASYRPDRTPKMRMALENVPLSHAAAGLSGSENIVVLRTKRYDAVPCVVKGPGAGADVTAAGVFGDILKLRDSSAAPKHPHSA